MADIVKLNVTKKVISLSANIDEGFDEVCFSNYSFLLVLSLLLSETHRY